MNKRVVLSLTLLLSGINISASDALARLRDKLPECPLSENARQVVKTTGKVLLAASAIKYGIDHHGVVTDRVTALGLRFMPTIAKTTTRTVTTGATDLLPDAVSSLFNQVRAALSPEALSLLAGVAAVKQKQIRTFVSAAVNSAKENNLHKYAALVGGPVVIANSDSVVGKGLGVLATAWALSDEKVRDSIVPSVNVTTGATNVNPVFQVPASTPSTATETTTSASN